MKSDMARLRTLAKDALSEGDNALRAKRAAMLAAKLAALESWRKDMRAEREAERFEFLKSIGLKFIPEYGWSN